MGKAKTVPHSQYSAYLDIIEATGWTWEELLDQPADMIDELIVRMSERVKEERRQAKKREKRPS